MKPGIGAVVGGKYRIEEQLGVGAIGVVYRVRHVALRKQLALKVLLPEAALDREVVSRFEREALVGAHVSHPNVAAAIDFGQLDDGSYYLVLELVRGATLRELLKQGPLPVRRGLRVARGIAEGLAHLHERGIVHRDLKPANVMLVDGTSSDIKLIDFGLARVQADGNLGRELSTSSGQWQAITDHGHFFGTVAYLAPEVRHGMGAVDERSDLYAFGVILCEMFAGRRPFVAPSMVEVLRLQLQGAPPSLASLTSLPLPDDLVDLVDSLLNKEASERPDAAHVVAELTAILAAVNAESAARLSTLPPPAVEAGELALPGPDVDPDDDSDRSHLPGGYEALLGEGPASARPASSRSLRAASERPPASARSSSARTASERPPASVGRPAVEGAPVNAGRRASDRPAAGGLGASPLVPPVAVTPAPPGVGAATAPTLGRSRARAVLGGGALV
ncbi:MAG: serine/threonine protein kinase, partial [Myxococcales bacterium]